MFEKKGELELNVNKIKYDFMTHWKSNSINYMEEYVQREKHHYNRNLELYLDSFIEINVPKKKLDLYIQKNLKKFIENNIESQIFIKKFMKRNIQNNIREYIGFKAKRSDLIKDLSIIITKIINEYYLKKGTARHIDLDHYIDSRVERKLSDYIKNNKTTQITIKNLLPKQNNKSSSNNSDH